MTAFDLLCYVADAQVNFPVLPGTNGPHQHRETPVRNYSHWIITLLNLYKWTGKSDYYEKALELASIFFDKQFFPNQKTYVIREHPGKDRCNGLIGQAWVLEALVELYVHTKKSEFLELAISVAESHQFNTKVGLWHAMEPDGNLLGIDPTFNHQLWFAYAVAPLRKYSTKIAFELRLFLKNLPVNLTLIKPSNLIFHPIDRNLSSPDSSIMLKARRYAGAFLRNYSGQRRKIDYAEEWEQVSVGYHVFNLYAFSLLRLDFPEHDFWQSRRFKDAANAMFDASFIRKLKDNPYGYAYNAPGFEVPVAAHFLSDVLGDIAHDWTNYFFNSQIQKTYDASKKSFSRNTPDPATLTARIYELTRLPVDELRKLTIDE